MNILMRKVHYRLNMFCSNFKHIFQSHAPVWNAVRDEEPKCFSHRVFAFFPSQWLILGFKHQNRAAFFSPQFPTKIVNSLHISNYSPPCRRAKHLLFPQTNTHISYHKQHSPLTWTNTCTHSHVHMDIKQSYFPYQGSNFALHQVWKCMYPLEFALKVYRTE